MKINKAAYFTSLLITAFVLLSCNGSGGEDGFSKVAEAETTSGGTTGSSSSTDTTLSIDSVTPSASPYTIGSSIVTFALNVSGAGSITYEFKLNSVSVQSGSSPFYNLNGSPLAAGNYTLEASATNSVNSVSHVFNITKNSPPAINTSTPAPGTINLNCASDSQAFLINTSDANGDAMTFAWTLNGSSAPTEIAVTSGASSSTGTLTPTCALNGTYTITGTVSDGTDTTSTSWTVVVANTNIASIDAYSPNTSPVVVLSTSANQPLTVSASGTPPLTYSWTLDSASVGTNSASYLFAETTAGSYAVQASLTDATSSDSHTFTVIKNGKPALSNVTPSSNSVKLNYSATKVFSIDATDANSDTMTYTWKLNGATSSYLAASATAGGSQAVFSPDTFAIGQQVVSVDVNDGRETTSQSWQVTVNRFRTSCNDLSADEICTVFGATGLGDDSSNTSGDAFINPTGIVGDGAGGFFISDIYKHVVWYVNNTGSSQTRLGVTVDNGKSKVVVGMGSSGSSPEGLAGTSYKLNSPQGLAWHSANSELYISDYGNHRVIRVTSGGIARKIAGNSTANNLAGHDAGLALSKTFTYAYGMALDQTNNLLYVGTYAGFIKKIDISNADYTQWTAEVVVGKRQGNDSISEGLEDGDIGYLVTGARAQDITGLALSSNGKFLYFTDQAHCRIRVANMDVSSVEHFGVTVAAGQVGTLTSQACGGTNEEAVGSARINRTYSNGLALHESGAVVLGFFVASYNSHEISYWNSSGVTQTIGGRTILDDNVGRVLGTGSASTSGDGGLGKDSTFYYPRGLYKDGNNLYVAEYYGARIRKLDLSIANGNVSSEAYFTSYVIYEDANDPGESQSYNLNSLTFDANSNKMFFSSYSTGRISSINTITGETSWELGRGNSSTSYSQTTPAQAYVSYPRAMTISDGVLLFVNWNNPGTNRSCNIGAFNNTGSDKTVYNSFVSDGKLNHVAGGSYAEGCASWNVAWSGDQANTTPLNSGEGLAAMSSTELLYSDYRDHCIKSIDSSGQVSVLLGLCGSAGNVSGIYNDTSVRIRYPRAIRQDPQNTTNFFFVDYGDSGTTSYLKYVNRTAGNVVINGTTVFPNFVQTVYTINGARGKDISLKDDWVCVSSGLENSSSGAHNVQCFDRTTGTQNRIGPSSTDFFKNREAMSSEQEGIDSSSASFATPRGIAFDQEGNLWVAEYNSGKIRMILKWW